MALALYNLHDYEKWDCIVKSFDNYDIYYLSEYVRAFKEHGDGEPVLIHFQDENFEAINVIMMRDLSTMKPFQNDLRQGEIFDLSTPYGYGGFLTKGSPTIKNIRKLDEEYGEFCTSQNIVSEFVRFHPVLQNNIVMKSVYDIIEIGETVTLDLTSEDIIWENITSKNRNMIRKAIKSGVEIKFALNDDIMQEFIKLYSATMKRDNAQKYYFFNNRFYKSLLENYEKNAKIFYAEYKGQIISAAIILYANNMMHYHLSGSDSNYRHIAPNNLLLWEAAKWGCKNGFKVFHLGGGVGGNKDNLFKFKKSFNRYSNTKFFIGKKIFDINKYEELVKKVENSYGKIDGEFFPKYRTIT